jgi:hypothetical protein
MTQIEDATHHITYAGATGAAPLQPRTLCDDVLGWRSGTDVALRHEPAGGAVEALASSGSL